METLPTKQKKNTLKNMETHGNPSKQKKKKHLQHPSNTAPREALRW